MLAAYGRHMRASPGRRVALSSSRSRHFWTRAAERTCADRVRLTEAPQRTRESSLCTCIRRCKLCRFVKPFVLRPLPKGPVAKAVIVYFMACKSCAYMRTTRSTAVSGSTHAHGHARRSRRTRRGGGHSPQCAPQRARRLQTRRGVLDIRGRRDFSRFDPSPGEAPL